MPISTYTGHGASRSTAPIVPRGDAERVVEAHRRRQLLDGTWRPMLAEHVERQLGPLRARLVGQCDTSSNLFASVVDQTSTMYDVEPEQAHDRAADLEVLRESFELGGWWTMAAQHQRYVRGLCESLVYVSWDTEAEHPSFELVTPDLVTMESAPTNRARPVTVWRARMRPIPNRPDGEEAVFWDRWSIADGVGSFSIWTNDRKREMTEAFVDPSEFNGERYPYVGEDGKPLLPYVLYHARGPGQGLFSPHLHSEVVFGTLQVGLLWTAAVHGMLRASWDQRVLLNGEVRGGTTEKTEGSGTRFLTPDPTSILQVRGDGASIAAWGASLDIEQAERFCRLYESRLAVHFGLSPADLVIESMNPASGASITVSQAGKRAIAKRDRINFARGDRELAEVVAAVNRGRGKRVSAKGYRLRYGGVALTIDERTKVVAYVEKEIALGLADRVTAYQEIHPGVTVEEAEADLAEIDARKEVEDRRARTMEALQQPAAEPEPPDDEDAEARDGGDDAEGEEGEPRTA